MARIVALAMALGACGAGPVGPSGEDGEAGDVGPPGSPGGDVVANVVCSKEDGGWRFTYSWVDLGNGDVETMCGISTPSFDFSSGAFYFSEQAGASSKACSLAVDMEIATMPTGGWWSFTMGTTIATAEYHDPSSSEDGSQLQFGAADCRVFTRDGEV